MGDEIGGKNPDSLVQKQKDALDKAKSVVQRLPVFKTPPQSQNVTDPVNLPKFITYPEFAPLPPGSGSLVSLRRLFLLLYLSAGTAATIYAVSKVFLSAY
jgi:hypothetical protein